MSQLIPCGASFGKQPVLITTSGQRVICRKCKNIGVRIRDLMRCWGDWYKAGSDTPGYVRHATSPSYRHR